MADVRANLVAKLESASSRFDELLAEMNDPAFASNQKRMIEAAKEHKQLARIVEPYRKYSQLQQQLVQAQALAEDPQADAEMRSLAEEEVRELAKASDAVMENIQGLLLMSDKAGIDSILVEIRAGTGGDEAKLFVADLMNMYMHFAQNHGWKVDVLDASPTELGGLSEVVLNVKGEDVYQYLSFEGGGHRVQRVPKTETQGRIHTSAATVAVLPEVEEVEVNIDWEKDVIEHVSRAGGPGGQNVNKVASAIRLEHLPTGITVNMREEKSQHKNRAKARRVLASRVFDHFRQQQLATEAATRKSMIGSGDRSQRVRTYNFPQNRCTDHRLKGTGSEGANFNLQQIMAGDMDEMVGNLIAAEKAEKLASL